MAACHPADLSREAMASGNGVPRDQRIVQMVLPQ